MAELDEARAEAEALALLADRHAQSALKASDPEAVGRIYDAIGAAIASEEASMATAICALAGASALVLLSRGVTDSGPMIAHILTNHFMQALVGGEIAEKPTFQA